MAGQDKDSQEEIRVNSSPDRYTFQAEQYIKRCEEEGKEPSEDYLDIYKSAKQRAEERMVDPVWQENNMEYDLRSTKWICDKVKASDVYAQNLYAAMCNNEFQKNDMMPILRDQVWGCSWRYAGGIIADMQETGDYIDWYCSGIRNTSDLTDTQYQELTEQQQQYYNKTKQYVSESIVTEEIRSDLKKLGWLVLDDKNDNF
jgi:hypothetical protein